MDSESECCESETESETMPSVSASPSVSDGASMQERWEAVAGMAVYARRLNRLEALDTALPYLPDGPHASALQHALVNSSDLPTTLQAVEKAALAMARAEDLMRRV